MEWGADGVIVGSALVKALGEAATPVSFCCRSFLAASRAVMGCEFVALQYAFPCTATRGTRFVASNLATESHMQEQGLEDMMRIAKDIQSGIA